MVKVHHQEGIGALIVTNPKKPHQSPPEEAKQENQVRVDQMRKAGRRSEEPRQGIPPTTAPTLGELIARAELSLWEATKKIGRLSRVLAAKTAHHGRREEWQAHAMSCRIMGEWARALHIRIGQRAKKRSGAHGPPHDPLAQVGSPSG